MVGEGLQSAVLGVFDLILHPRVKAVACFQVGEVGTRGPLPGLLRR